MKTREELQDEHDAVLQDIVDLLWIKKNEPTWTQDQEKELVELEKEEDRLLAALVEYW